MQVRPRVLAVKRKLIVKRKLSTKQKKALCGMRSQAKKALIRARRAPPNPMMSTAFINFLTEHRKKNEHLTVKKRLQKGAMLWSKLTKQQQDQYRTVVSVFINLFISLLQFFIFLRAIRGRGSSIRAFKSMGYD